MARFVCKSAVIHDGKEYAAGESVELSDSQAAPLLADFVVEASIKSEKKPPVQEIAEKKGK
jgi:hypothetical protein